MTERPIIFSAPMVKAILEGRKTQTRRILKPQPVAADNGAEWLISPRIRWYPGVKLWVRETCRAEELASNNLDGVRYSADDAFIGMDDLIPGNTPTVSEKWLDLFYYRGRGTGLIGHPVPSIHMPRWASRITLLVEAVRVERLQDISADDAIAEGIDWSLHSASFRDLWNQINGPGAWGENPWVSVTTFRRIKP